MEKPTVRVLKTIALVGAATIGALMLVLGVLNVGAYYLFRPGEDEVARVTSPDRVLDAVLVEVNGGATTSFRYDIYVVARGDSTGGRSVTSLYGAARSDSAYGANLRWGDERTLAVEFLSAREVTRHVSSIEVADRTVKVALRSGVSDPAAPPGGMLYNLQGRPHHPLAHASEQPR